MFLFQRICRLKYSLLLFVFSILLTQCQPEQVDCKDIKNGRFRFYSKRSGDHYVVIRKDSLQKELNINTGDTTYWKIKWLDDCIFSAHYISGGPQGTEEDLDFLNNHQTVMQILEISPDYYVVRGSLDSVNSEMSITDTVWIEGRENR